MKINKKIITVVSLVFLWVGLLVFSKAVKKQQELRPKAGGGNASLSLFSSRTVNINEEFNLPVMLNTDGETVVAVDVVITFNPNHLELTDIIPHPESGSLEIFMPLDSNGNFKTQEVINKANSNGEIAFGTASYRWNTERVLNGFQGVMGPANPLAVLKFKPKVVNSGTAVNFSFTSGSTTDSNLVSGDSDILSQVTNSMIEITDTPDQSDCKPCPDGSFAPEETTSFNCDTNGNEEIDYGRWAKQYYDIKIRGESVPDDELYGDFNCDGDINGLDYGLWYKKWCPTAHTNCQ